MSTPAHGIGHNGGPRFDGAPHAPQERLLYDIEEARQLLGGIGRSTLYKLVKGGRIKFVKLGSRSLLNRDDLNRLARSLGQAA